MKKTKNIFAVLFLVTISFTIVPPALFHHHHEDEHALAKLTHNATHHCELDEQLCQQNESTLCQNHQHLSKPIHKCFHCNYSFFNQYYISFVEVNLNFNHTLKLNQPFVVTNLRGLSLTFGNKGPPALA